MSVSEVEVCLDKVKRGNCMDWSIGVVVSKAAKVGYYGYETYQAVHDIYEASVDEHSTTGRKVVKVAKGAIEGAVSVVSSGMTMGIGDVTEATKEAWEAGSLFTKFAFWLTCSEPIPTSIVDKYEFSQEKIELLSLAKAKLEKDSDLGGKILKTVEEIRRLFKTNFPHIGICEPETSISTHRFSKNGPEKEVLVFSISSFGHRGIGTYEDWFTKGNLKGCKGVPFKDREGQFCRAVCFLLGSQELQNREALGQVLREIEKMDGPVTFFRQLQWRLNPYERVYNICLDGILEIVIAKDFSDIQITLKTQEVGTLWP
jgi:hypothetical protein